MAGDGTSQFDAIPSILGYLYQVRYGLLVLLERVGIPGGAVTLERLDDVAFEQNGKAVEILQTKHHLTRAATLGDTSSDLWKTLRVWSTLLKDRRVILPGPTLALLTTSVARDGDIVRKLRLADRDIEEVRKRLDAVAAEGAHVERSRVRGVPCADAG